MGQSSLGLLLGVAAAAAGRAASKGQWAVGERAMAHASHGRKTQLGQSEVRSIQYPVTIPTNSVASTRTLLPAPFSQSVNLPASRGSECLVT